MSQQLQTFEVPRVFVDFTETTSGKELRSDMKEDILDYVQLEETVKSFGMQHITAAVLDNLVIESMRDHITNKWGNDFFYRLDQQNLPLSFRSNMAPALLYDKIRSTLSDEGEIEVYVSRSIKEMFGKHNIKMDRGLQKVNYSGLPPELQRDLIEPMITNLNRAQLMARANLLFPDGIPVLALELVDPRFLASQFFGGQIEERVYFNQITNLEVQGSAAAIALSDPVKIQYYKPLAQEVEKAKTRERERKAEIEEPKTEEYTESKEYDPFEQDWQAYALGFGDTPPQRINMQTEGTNFFEMFPLRKGETKEDVWRAYKRLTLDQYLRGKTFRGDHREDIRLILYENGRAEMDIYEMFAGSRTGDRETINLLQPSDHESEEKYYRKPNLAVLAINIRQEVDKHQEVMTQARAKFGNNLTFVVERNYAETVTGRKDLPEYTPRDEKAWAEELTRQAKEMLGMEQEEYTPEKDQSGKPLDPSALYIDRRLLQLLQQRSFGRIGKYFSQINSLLRQFGSVIGTNQEYYETLGIRPTTDPEDIRRAFRRKAHEVHPDLGIPEEQAERTAAFIRVHTAYKSLTDALERGRNDPNIPTYYLGRISELFRVNEGFANNTATGSS